MSDIVIHHINISYDESDERVRNFVKYLKGENQTEEMKSYYNQAMNSPDEKIYINDKAGNEFTLIYKSNYNCTLRLRGM